MEFKKIPDECLIMPLEMWSLDLAKMDMGTTVTSSSGEAGCLLARESCSGLENTWNAGKDNDWVEVTFGFPGMISAVNIDTREVPGSKEGVHFALEGQEEGEGKFQTLIKKGLILPGKQNGFFQHKSKLHFKRIRLSLSGPVAIGRLRVYGEVKAAPLSNDLVDVLDAKLGTKMIVCSQFKNHWDLLRTSSVCTSGGWTTKPMRGEEFIVFRLPRPALIKRLMIDTTGFEGNEPKHFILEASVDTEEWTGIVLANSHIRPGECQYELVPQTRRFSYLRLKVFPFGGVRNVSLFGRFCDEDYQDVDPVVYNPDLPIIKKAKYFMDPMGRLDFFLNTKEAKNIYVFLKISDALTKRDLEYSALGLARLVACIDPKVNTTVGATPDFLTSLCEKLPSDSSYDFLLSMDNILRFSYMEHSSEEKGNIDSILESREMQAFPADLRYNILLHSICTVKHFTKSLEVPHDLKDLFQSGHEDPLKINLHLNHPDLKTTPEVTKFFKIFTNPMPLKGQFKKSKRN